MKEKQKIGVSGITLVALVITIIVLVIIAGGVISMIIVDNGLFQKIENSLNKYENKVEKEKEELTAQSELLNMEYIANGEPIIYTITYNANGGTGAQMTQTECKYGESVSLTANSYTRDKCEFVGWGLSADGKEVTYEKDEEYSISLDKDIILYAMWEHKHTATGNIISGDPLSDEAIYNENGECYQAVSSSVECGGTLGERTLKSWDEECICKGYVSWSATCGKAAYKNPTFAFTCTKCGNENTFYQASDNEHPYYCSDRNEFVDLKTGGAYYHTWSFSGGQNTGWNPAFPTNCTQKVNTYKCSCGLVSGIQGAPNK